MKICLDLHDFSVVNNRLNLLLEMKDHFPEFRVSLFTVPVDRKDTWGGYLIRSDILSEIKRHLDWIQIIPHGLFHNRHEMRYVTYKQFKDDLLPQIEQAFNRDALPYERGFCAPHWSWNPDVVKVLNELGWWGAVDPRQPNMSTPKRFFRYSYCINEFFPVFDGLKLHGHIYGTANDLGKCINNIFDLVPVDIKWCFASELLEDNNES